MKNIVIILILIIAVFGSIFYWFQLRPGQIRKECTKQILESARGKNLSTYDLSIALDYCLTMRGLTK